MSDNSDTCTLFKRFETVDEPFQVAAVSIKAKRLENEADVLKELLAEKEITVSSDGLPVKLMLEEIDLPVRLSAYQEEIEKQGYRLNISKTGVEVKASTPVGVLYGVFSLAQLITHEKTLPSVKIADWPDLAVRAIMLDPSRQMETMEYYKRVISHCARYKINLVHLHLTDDQSCCLYHEDYEGLVHPRAFTKEDVNELVEFAARYNIELLPEIESLGHSRTFFKLDDAKDYLHQSDEKEATEYTYMDISGYTNILCPASKKAMTYLDKMYERTSELFSYPNIHIGCDEVGITRCEKCENKFGDISKTEWFRIILRQCRDIARKHGRKAVVWGDMLLADKEILDEFSNDDFIIYDWHYETAVTEESVVYFKEKGFEVVACPALVCWPSIIMSNKDNFENIKKFTRIAYENDLMGVDTTVWIPVRYFSDALWTGLSYAAVHAWNGSRLNDSDFYESFSAEFFGVLDDAKKGFGKKWNKLLSLVMDQKLYPLCCWDDAESLKAASTEASKRKGKVEEMLEKHKAVNEELVSFGFNVTKHKAEWQAIESAAALNKYLLHRFLCSAKVENNSDLIKELDAECVRLHKLVEEDWDKNRYADDANKAALHQGYEHILNRLFKIHEFHKELMK